MTPAVRGPIPPMEYSPPPHPLVPAPILHFRHHHPLRRTVTPTAGANANVSAIAKSTHSLCTKLLCNKFIAYRNQF